jgi:hypothetical protein
MMRYTVDHDFIRQWIEYYGGLPALRVQPHRERREIEISWEGRVPELTPMSWQEFFEWFESENLSFGFSDEGAVDPRYVLFKDRDEVELFDPIMRAEERNFDPSDPFIKRKEWKYDKPHRE